MKTIRLTIRFLEFVLLTYILWVIIGGLARASELPLPVRVMACESSGETNVWGDDKVSYGIAQFQEETFREMSKRAGVPSLDWRDPVHQIALLNWALKHGLGNHWTCYRKIERGKWKITPALDRKMRRNTLIRKMYPDYFRNK